MFRIILILCVLTLASCATGTKTVLSTKKINDPKVIALDAERTPWVVEIENRLRQKGFKVLRWASQKHVKEKVSQTRDEAFREASTRYVLAIEGYAPLDKMNRCFGGGFDFEYLTAELIDVESNETIVSTSGSGFSEGCAPMSGTIFEDIAASVNEAWN